MHMKTHNTASKARLQRRLKIIEGQVRGLQGMLQDSKYCIDIITQISAVKRSLSSVEDLLMEDHLKTCVLSQVKSGESGKATAEVLKVYKLKRT